MGAWPQISASIDATMPGCMDDRDWGVSERDHALVAGTQPKCKRAPRCHTKWQSGARKDARRHH
eukprot:2415331-Alexandrium_andersonii.AAC.1